MPVWVRVELSKHHFEARGVGTVHRGLIASFPIVSWPAPLTDWTGEKKVEGQYECSLLVCFGDRDEL